MVRGSYVAVVDGVLDCVLILAVAAALSTSSPPVEPEPVPVVIAPKDSTVVYYARHYDIRYAMASEIVEHARKWSVPLPIAFRLVHTESRFNPEARNPKSSATGLTQILVPTARRYDSTLSRDDLHEVEQNLDLGFRFLASLHTRYGNWRKAVLAYYYGPGVVDTATSLDTDYVDRIVGP